MVYFGNFGFIAPSQSHQYLSFITRVISLALDEFVTLGETLSIGKYVSIYATDTIVISELLENVVDRVRNLFETVQIEQGGFIGDDFVEADFDIDWEVTRIVTKFRNISQTIVISDALTRFKKSVKALAQTITIGDLATVTGGKVLTLVESISIGGSPTKVLTKFRGLIQSITIGESLTKAKVVPRSLTQTVTIGEALTKLSLKVRALAQSITIGEALTRSSIKSRAPGFPESVTIGEALTKSKKTIRALAQSITIGETLTRVSTKTRSIAQTITITGSPIIGKFKSIFINEIPVIVTEQAIPAFIKKSVKNLAETVSIGESLTRTKKTIRSIAQSISIGGVATFSQIILRNIAQTITIGDNLTRLKSITRSIAQSINISDAVTRSRTFVKSITQSINISEVLTSARVKGLLILQSIVISDFASVIRLLSGAPRWLISGQVSDFPNSIENMVKAYVNTHWTSQLGGFVTNDFEFNDFDADVITTTPIGSDTSSEIQIDNFAYDGFRTYYMKIREIASDVQTRRIRFNTYEFETPIEFDLFSRRLSKGEAFTELNDMINELMRIFGTFQRETMFGIQGVTFERISPIEREKSAAQTVWARRFKIVLHYYKTSTIG